MSKCSKCGLVISDNDNMAWKCTSCGKAFKVNLSKLKKVQAQKDKPENAGKMLLKCPVCGSGIDNGNEKIVCKCSACGNIMAGNLKYFVGKEEESSDGGKTNAENRGINLIECPECGKKILSDSKMCGFCGYPIEEIKTKNNLIKCPECGREISNTIKECIHCGYPLKKKKHVPIKLIVIALLSVVLLILALLMVKNIFSHVVQHTELFEIMEYKQPSSIKKILGNNYEYKTYDDGSSCEDYDDIEVDGLMCSLVEISYDYGEYERVLFEVSDITANEKKILVKDFITQYGKDYDYKEDEYNGKKSFDYIWDFEQNRRVSLDIRESKDDGMYWIRINSFHNWMK